MGEVGPVRCSACLAQLAPRRWRTRVGKKGVRGLPLLFRRTDFGVSAINITSINKTSMTTVSGLCSLSSGLILIHRL
eukprot:scaffold9337_cov137-Skeletonema_marinoi.AAC.2